MLLITSLHNEEYRETALRQIWPSVLHGEWQSTATHFHQDGTQLVESGRVTCELAGTTTVCARNYISVAGTRIGVQVWAQAPDGSLEIISVSPQRRTTQRAATAMAAQLNVDGAIPWRGGMARTRGRWVEEKGELLFRNETEESPSHWRVDYEERLARVK
jgi:hypothetical protein